MSDKLSALSLEALDKIKQIERYAESCKVSDIGNPSAATRDIRSCAIAMFEVYWRDSDDGVSESFLAQAKREIAACLSSTFRLALDVNVAKVETIDALEKHIGALWPGGFSLNPVTEDIEPNNAAPERKTPIKIQPNRELLKNREGTLSRPKAAEALGLSLRQFDRLKNRERLQSVGPVTRKRYKISDIRKLLEERN